MYSTKTNCLKVEVFHALRNNNDKYSVTTTTNCEINNNHCSKSKSNAVNLMICTSKKTSPKKNTDGPSFPGGPQKLLVDSGLNLCCFRNGDSRCTNISPWPPMFRNQQKHTKMAKVLVFLSVRPGLCRHFVGFSWSFFDDSKEKQHCFGG